MTGSRMYQLFLQQAKEAWMQDQLNVLVSEFGKVEESKYPRRKLNIS
tara:strand:+ start:6380 stop:6520 length:141 start_codon:yes stop_codon:yes gene_type:complete